MNNGHQPRLTNCSDCGIALEADRPRNHWGRCPNCRRIAKRKQLAIYRARHGKLNTKAAIAKRIKQVGIIQRLHEARTIKQALCGQTLTWQLEFISKTA